jgi:hypothetical protein
MNTHESRPSVYQVWGQSARDKYRFTLRPGNILIIKCFSSVLWASQRATTWAKENALLVLRDGDFLQLDRAHLDQIAAMSDGDGSKVSQCLQSLCEQLQRQLPVLATA